MWRRPEWGAISGGLPGRKRPRRCRSSLLSAERKAAPREKFRLPRTSRRRFPPSHSLQPDPLGRRPTMRPYPRRNNLLPRKGLQLHPRRLPAKERPRRRAARVRPPRRLPRATRRLAKKQAGLPQSQPRLPLLPQRPPRGSRSRLRNRLPAPPPGRPPRRARRRGLLNRSSLSLER